MKKTIAAILISVVLFVAAPLAFAQEPVIKVYIDERQVQFAEQPVNVEGVTMVPFRPIFETFGIQVSWDGEKQAVTGNKQKWSISLTIDHEQAIVNGETIVMPKAARNINGHTFIPLRFVGEATGRTVGWDDASKTVRIVSTLRSDLIDILYSNDLKYEGERNGEHKEGKGKYYYRNTLWYEGDFKANKMEGFGKQYDPQNPNSYYEGQYLDNLSNGKGKLVFDDGSYYEGDFKEGRREGIGKLYDKTGKLKYEGGYARDSREGKGKYYNADGTLFYEGDFKAGVQHGVGKLYNKGTLIYEGDFYEGKQTGKGKIYRSDNAATIWYEGEIRDAVRHGQGKMYDNTGRLAYEGQFKSNNQTGKGILYYGNGQMYEGEVYGGKPEGIGTLSDASGKVVSAGYFENGAYKSPRPDEVAEHYKVMTLKKQFTQQVIDGLMPNSYGLDSSEAIMVMELPTKEALLQFQQLSDSAKKQVINSYAQDNWGNVLGVKHCYAKVNYQGLVYAEADISYKMVDASVKLDVYPDGK